MDDLFDNNDVVKSSGIDFSNLNKASLAQVAGGVIDKVANGEEDALEVYIKAKAMSEVASNILKATKELATDEAEKYGKGDSVMLGCDFVVKGGLTSYSFDHDHEWQELNTELTELKHKIKTREKLMIEATKYAELVDKDTGEVVPQALVAKQGTSILTISIPKK